MKSFVLLALFVVACSAVKNPGFRGADTVSIFYFFYYYFFCCLLKFTRIFAYQTKWTPFSCRAGVLGPNDDRLKEIGACGGSDVREHDKHK
jgi:hypothetical protein